MKLCADEEALPLLPPEAELEAPALLVAPESWQPVGGAIGEVEAAPPEEIQLSGAPEEAQSVAPEEPQLSAVPEEAQSVAPEEAQSVAPGETQLAAAPEEIQLAATPQETQLAAAPEETQPAAAPEETQPNEESPLAAALNAAEALLANVLVNYSDADFRRLLRGTISRQESDYVRTAFLDARGKEHQRAP
jgi:hypothetical protein